MAALAQSTRAWWKIRPWLHLATQFSGATTVGDHLLRGLLMRMMAMRERLAMTPMLPRLVRMMAETCWSSVHTSSGLCRTSTVRFPSPVTPPFAPTTAIADKQPQITKSEHTFTCQYDKCMFVCFLKAFTLEHLIT